VKIRTGIAVAALTMSAFVLSGCAQKNDTPDAVKQGVVRDLAKKFDMTKMDVIVDSVSFRDKEADATVTFVVKGGSASQGMTMKYVMERHDDGEWYIKSRASTAAAGAPDGEPAGTDAAAGAMPAGHPAAATAASGSKFNLPPGHPELGQ
jgi:hypothetical protein